MTPPVVKTKPYGEVHPVTIFPVIDNLFVVHSLGVIEHLGWGKQRRILVRIAHPEEVINTLAFWQSEGYTDDYLVTHVHDQLLSVPEDTIYINKRDGVTILLFESGLDEGRPRIAARLEDLWQLATVLRFIQWVKQIRDITMRRVGVVAR